MTYTHETKAPEPTMEEVELQNQLEYHAEEIAHWLDADRVVVLVFRKDKEGKSKLEVETIVEAETVVARSKYR